MGKLPFVAVYVLRPLFMSFCISFGMTTFFRAYNAPPGAGADYWAGLPAAWMLSWALAFVLASLAQFPVQAFTVAVVKPPPQPPEAQSVKMKRSTNEDSKTVLEDPLLDETHEDSLPQEKKQGCVPNHMRLPPWCFGIVFAICFTMCLAIPISFTNGLLAAGCCPPPPKFWTNLASQLPLSVGVGLPLAFVFAQLFNRFILPRAFLPKQRSTLRNVDARCCAKLACSMCRVSSVLPLTLFQTINKTNDNNNIRACSCFRVELWRSDKDFL